MARIRTIKPDFFKNEDLAEIPAMTRLLFIGLWTQADREGRLRDRAKRLKIELFPYENYDVEKGLQQLETGGFIVRYKANVNVTDRVLAPEQPAEEVALIQIVNFLKHQQPNKKEAASTLPTPYKHSAYTVQALQEREREMEGKGNDDGIGKSDTAAEESPEDILQGEEESPPVAHAPPDEPPTHAQFMDIDLAKEKVFVDKESFVRIYAGWGLSQERVYEWLCAFNVWLRYSGETRKLERDYRQHFGNWLKGQDLQSDPKDYSPVIKPNATGKVTAQPKSGFGKSAGAIKLAHQLAKNRGFTGSGGT